MATISSSDILYATIVRHGSTILSLRISGITSLTQLLIQIRSHITDTAGLVTLKLRNGTQGWTRSRSLLLAA